MAVEKRTRAFPTYTRAKLCEFIADPQHPEYPDGASADDIRAEIDARDADFAAADEAQAQSSDNT